MYRYKLTLAYDGTNYCGWQWQPKGRSIERVVKETFLHTFSKEHIFMVGASRTDAGVHAQGQAIRIMTDLQIPCQKMKYCLNNALPSDIIVQTIEQVNELFHPQHGITYKEYRYTLFTQQPTIYQQRFGWHIQRSINISLLKKTAALFIGTHDFQAFCKEEIEKDTTRTITYCSIIYDKDNGSYIFIIRGSSFLRHMVRRIVGACVSVAFESSIVYSDIEKGLTNQTTIPVALTAPAKGLCLEKIVYGGEK